jgi:hypothetical protein
MLRFSIFLILIAAVIGGFLAFNSQSSAVPGEVFLSPSPVPILETVVLSAPGRCTEETVLYAPEDTQFCNATPKLDRFRLFEVDLSANRILFYQQGMLAQTFPIAYQAAYGKWFQTPTGYFRIGVKHAKFRSSIVPVFMEDAVQIYEDFFIHAIPYYADGTRVTSQFSGGCIRLEDDVAENFYAITQRGDDVISYATLDGYRIREGFVSPVDIGRFWVRQRFNSPLKVDFTWHADNRENYIQHSGLDLAPPPAGGTGVRDLRAYAIADGTVAAIVRNGERDRGLGNTVILSVEIEGVPVYALYGHLARIREGLEVSQLVQKGEEVGVIGNTGYGCDYWRVGEDGCDATGEPDTHLHLELKTKPVLDSPVPDPDCGISKEIRSCVGSTSEDPKLFGYYDPFTTLFESSSTDYQ